MDDRAFGVLVRAARWRKRLRDDELARQIGQPSAFVQALEQGRQTDPISRETAHRLQQALDLDATDVESFRLRRPPMLSRDDDLWEIVELLRAIRNEPR